jgi:phosphoglycerate dehydrogenase-like enzyme
MPLRAGVFDAGDGLLTALRAEASRLNAEVEWIGLASLGQTERAAALPRLDMAFTQSQAVNRAMLSAMTQCQMLGILGEFRAGTAPGIDLEFARQAGIYVGALPGADAAGAAQWAFDRIREYTRAWTRNRQHRKPKIGLLGLGATGFRLAELCAKLKADLLACDPFTGLERFQKYAIYSVALESLIAHSDILSIQIPLHRATRGILNASQLRGMRQGCAVVCLSDPRVADLEALAEWLGSGRLSGCAFAADLAPHLPPGHALLTHPAVAHGTDALQSDHSPELLNAMAAAANELVMTMARGQRPPHLLIDPPCPRHILALAGQLTF